ncbi:MAG: cation-translocating P-type ATPase [Patescibacteria group bacterium]|nr:cation-translocating P-type ATPase [Patescibacteria group bacterium]
MPVQGLTSSEALSKLKDLGPNEIAEKKRNGPLSIFLGQFANFLVILLIIAAALSFFLGDATDGIFILLIVILNGALGFAQEVKAEKAIEALKKITISRIRVLRDGVETEVDSRMLVPGDVFFVEEGVKIPADGKVLNAYNLEVNESSLTGESLPVAKSVSAENSGKVVFSGTVVAGGRGQILVVATGMRTRFGKIAESLQNIPSEPTPLQRKINSLGRQLGILGVAASLLVLILAIVRSTPIFDSILTAISLSVAAIPEGLPAVITITLAVGVQRMSKAKAVVRKMTAVEALGSTSTIATDKTGTLTENQMRVREVWFDGASHSSDNLEPKESLEKIIHISSICNNSSLVYKKDGGISILGDTTEGSLLLFVHNLGLNPQQIKEAETMVAELPFNTVSKTMTSVYTHAGQTEILTKGAPESILKISSQILWMGKPESLTESKRQLVTKAFEQSAATGLRMIAFSFKNPEVGNPVEIKRDEAESQMVFAGFVGIADPPREEAKAAVRQCKDAGIRIIMVTGDNELTANAIGSELGIIEEGEDIVTGSQLDSYSDDDLIKILPKVKIFARTTPEHKFRIVKSLQKLGEVVAVTGDGVNDALALKQADVGVAMGRTGTDVAKEAADLVITDDNFASIVRAVEEGRVIFENVKSAVKYLIGCNSGEVLAVLLGIIFGWPLILTPIQILYVNLITDGLPAIALALTPKHTDTMQRKPRKGEEIITGRDLPWFAEVTSLTTAVTLMAFYLGLQLNISAARTLALTVIVFAQHFVLLDVWSRNKSGINVYLLKNPVFLLAFAFPFLLQPILTYLPLSAKILELTPISPADLGLVFLLSLAVFIVSELRKLVLKKNIIRS